MSEDDTTGPGEGDDNVISMEQVRERRKAKKKKENATTSAKVGDLQGVIDALKNEDDLKGVFIRNEFSGERIQTRALPNQKPFDEPQLMDESASTFLRAWLQRNGYGNVKDGDVKAALAAHLKEHTFNPVLADIGDCHKQWRAMKMAMPPGYSVIDHFLTKVCRAPCDEPHLAQYYKDVSRVMFLSYVGRALTPGFRCETMVVLEGEQGIGKTTLCRMLAGDNRYFYRLVGNPKDRHTVLRYRGRTVVEVAELLSLSRQPEMMKIFLDDQDDTERVMYGSTDDHWPRSFIPIGTTNETEYIQDKTGGRRYLPVRCGEIDLETMDVWRPLLIGEAYERLELGEPAYMKTDEEKARAKLEQSKRVSENAYDEILREFVGLEEEKARVMGKDRCIIPKEDVRMHLGLTNDRLDDRKNKAIKETMMKTLGYKDMRPAGGARKMAWGKEITR
jgi:predicted P-loop ATPase